jgi:hypothetical protein
MCFYYFDKQICVQEKRCGIQVRNEPAMCGTVALL